MEQVHICFLLLFHRSVTVIIRLHLQSEGKTTGFAWTYLLVAFVKIGSASALIFILYYLSVCEETSVLTVYCRKPALQLLIVSMVKKHIHIFNWYIFIFKNMILPF